MCSWCCCFFVVFVFFEGGGGGGQGGLSVPTVGFVKGLRTKTGMLQHKRELISTQGS